MVLDQKKEFDSIFYDVAVRISALDMTRAEKVADSLYRGSKTEIQKVKSLMLLADLLEKQGRRNEAIEYALKAEELASANLNYQWMARVYGFLATQYRIVGLADHGKTYLQKSVAISDKFTDESSYDSYMGIIFQEKAYYAIGEKKYGESIELLKHANIFFESQKDASYRDLSLGINSEMLGRSFLFLRQYDSAKYYYDESLNLLAKSGVLNSQWEGIVYHGKGLISLESKEYDVANLYLIKSLKIAESTQYAALLELVYRDLSRYYGEIRDVENYAIYHKKYVAAKDDNLKAVKSVANSEFNRFVEKQRGGFSFVYIIISGIAILFVGSVLYLLIVKRNPSKVKQIKGQKVVVKDLVVSENESLKQSTNESMDRFMPEETEKTIIDMLQEFENSNEFTDAGLTLTELSAKFKINPKYLSWVINKHKKKDFNNYINQLRISYIIEKMKNDPAYLHYKISYLSSECGFSSHSKFAAIFKKETGFTPSSFIKKLPK